MPDFLRLVASPGNPLDWIAVFAFVAIAFIFFLAPVLGYQSATRGLVLIALYILLAYTFFTLLELLINYFIYLTVSNIESRQRADANISFLFALLRLTLFLASQVALVLGLRNLKQKSE